MFRPKTFTELCNAMQTRAVVTINGYVGIVNGIVPEDGSGRCWLVTISLKETDDQGQSEMTAFFRE